MSRRNQIAEALSQLWPDVNDREAASMAVDLLPLVDRLCAEAAAEEIERIAELLAWTTEHDNEVVSTRDLYEQMARLRSELEPVTFDFPPSDNNAAAVRPSKEQQP